MRIAYVFDQVLPQTATDTEQAVSMASALGAAGASVDLVLPQRFGQPAVTIEDLVAYYQVEPSFRLQVIPAIVPLPGRVLKSMHALLGPSAHITRSADVVYTRNVSVLLGLRAFTDRPLVFEHYRPWPDQHRGMRYIFRRLARDRRSPTLVLHSAFAAESYQRIGFDGNRILVAHNGFDPRRVEPRLSIVEARTRHGLPQDAQIVAYAGHVHPRKGVDTLIELAKVTPEATFLLIGSEGEGPIERSAVSLRNVILRPWLAPNAMMELLYAADVLAIPPTATPLKIVGTTVLPMKTFLYMASGRAILGPDMPDLREVLHDGRNATLVRPDDLSAARTGLRSLLRSATLRERLGQTARADAEAMTWRARGERVLAFLERSLARV